VWSFTTICRLFPVLQLSPAPDSNMLSFLWTFYMLVARGFFFEKKIMTRFFFLSDGGYLLILAIEPSPGPLLSPFLVNRLDQILYFSVLSKDRLCPLLRINVLFDDSTNRFSTSPINPFFPEVIGLPSLKWYRRPPPPRSHVLRFFSSSVLVPCKIGVSFSLSWNRN